MWDKEWDLYVSAGLQDSMTSSDNSVSVSVHQHLSLLLPVVVLWGIWHMTYGGRGGGQCGGGWCTTGSSRWGSNTTDSTIPDVTSITQTWTEMDETALRRLDSGSVKDISQRCFTDLWPIHRGSRWATGHKRMHLDPGHELLVFLPFLTFFTDCFFLMNLVASCGRSSPSPLASGMGSIPPKNHKRRSSSKCLWPHLTTSVSGTPWIRLPGSMVFTAPQIPRKHGNVSKLTNRNIIPTLFNPIKRGNWPQSSACGCVG